MGRPVVHFEIGGGDTARAATFFAELFGWRFAAGPHGSQQITDGSAGLPGHLVALGHEPRHHVTLYIEVESLEDTLAKVQALGGRTLVPPMSLGDGRRFAWMSDLDGNPLGLFDRKASS